MKWFKHLVLKLFMVEFVNTCLVVAYTYCLVAGTNYFVTDNTYSNDKQHLEIHKELNYS